jgi:hypothetical protein
MPSQNTMYVHAAPKAAKSPKKGCKRKPKAVAANPPCAAMEKALQALQALQAIMKYIGAVIEVIEISVPPKPPAPLITIDGGEEAEVTGTNVTSFRNRSNPAQNTMSVYVAPKVAKSPKKGRQRKPKAVAAHPPCTAMAMAAVKVLKERNGSSLKSIKKYIGANYKVDIVKITRFINKALKGMVEKGILEKKKGSFKLSARTKEEKPAAKKPKAKKAKSPKKKSTTPKK